MYAALLRRVNVSQTVLLLAFQVLNLQIGFIEQHAKPTTEK
jgi:hypothetical protein